MKKLIKNFFTVTPKEWVAVQVFCAGIVTAITISWESISQVFGPDDSEDMKTIMRIALGIAAFIAAYAQTKTKKK